MMKSTLRLFVVLLLVAGICFGGLSCGSSKSKPKKKRSTRQSQNDKKQKNKNDNSKVKKEEPKPVVKKEPTVPPKPPLPQDLSQWGKKEVLRARAEGHQLLVKACERWGEPFEGDPAAASVVEIIRQILLPLPIPEMRQIPKPVITKDTPPKEKQRLEREYEKQVKEEEKRVKNVPTLDSSSIANLIEILGQNGDDAAWKLLLDMLQRKITVDDDSDIDRNIVQTILAHPRSNNIDIIFTMLTNPSSLLRPASASSQNDDAKKKFITPEEIRNKTVEWFKKYADPEFRKRLVEYLIAHPKEKQLKELVLPFLLEDKVGNIQVKAMMYAADGFLSDSDRQKVERYFLECACSAFATLTYQAVNTGKSSSEDICTVIQQKRKAEQEAAEEKEEASETDDANANSSKSAQQTPAKPKIGKNGTYRIEPYEDISMSSSEAPKVMALHPEYAQMVLQIVWQNDFISKQFAAWETKKDLNAKEFDIATRFLFALPLGNYRQYWSDYFDSIYQDGPSKSGLDKCPLMGGTPIDPGILMELKKVKRNVQPPTSQKQKNSKAKQQDTFLRAKQREIALQAAWMDAVRSAVKVQMDRCNAACSLQSVLGIDVSKLKQQIPFSIPEGAKIVSEYHFIFPPESVQSITGITFDSYEIHFVQINWDGPAQTIASKIKYKGSGTAKRRYSTSGSDKTVWLEYNSEDFSESMDIRFSTKGVSNEAMREPATGPIQIMSIRVRPTGK